MKKINSNGFMLAETLIVTSFVAGVLVFIFIQFTTLSKKYDDSYKYNTVEGLYALEDIVNYIKSDDAALNYINNNLINFKYIDLTDCNIFSNKDYCLKLFQIENIKDIVVSTNLVDYNYFSGYDYDFIEFVKKINKEGNEKYRILASFENSTYATLRFGE